jgi:hypothetical protein
VAVSRGIHRAGAGEPVGYLTLEPLELQPAIQSIIDTAGPFVGSGIYDDLDKFNHFLVLLTGQRLRFQPPMTLP